MENKMKNIRFNKIGMPKYRAFLKAALMAEASRRAKNPSFFFRLLPVAVALFAMAAVGMYMVIENNESPEKVNNLGGVWCTYDDHYQGGSSTVWPPASIKGENSFVKSSPGSGGKGYAVRITGVAGTKLGYDYIGVNTFLSPRSTCPDCFGIDLTKFRGIKFKVKGTVEAGQVFFVLPHESRQVDKARGICKTLTSYADYEVDITKHVTSQWKEVKIDFRKDLKQPDYTKPSERAAIEKVLADANLVKWMYKNGNGHRVDIWLDKMEFY